MQTTLERRSCARPLRRKMTRREFELAGAKGLYGPEERLELIEGEVFAKLSPQLTPHAVAIHLTVDALREAFPTGFHIRNQAPMGLNDYNEPEPDVSVVAGGPRDYLADHPSLAVLVVEVSDSTLRFDLNKKARIYARAQIPEYWVLNLRDRLLHVHRTPSVDNSTSIGFGYVEIIRMTETDSVSPLFAPTVLIHVADLLP